MDKTELKDIVENIEHCSFLVLRIMNAMIDEEITYSDFEHNMLVLSSNIDDETTRLNTFINATPDNKEGK